MNRNISLVILDDDPTGTQTVHDVNVYTSYDRNAIESGMGEGPGMFFLLTNSRAFSAEKTERIHKQIGRDVMTAAKRCGRDFIIVSRGDSTLRGHWPLETDALTDALEEGGLHIDGQILCPFFPEGGRITKGDVHYVREKGALIPAGDTEFARDATFGYRSSNLKEYVEEKTKGRIKAEEVISVSLEDLRRDSEQVKKKLTKMNGGVMIVNAETYDDLEVFCGALWEAMDEGRHYVMRTAAAVPKVLGGVTDIPCLEGSELVNRGKNGGLVVVGSHVKKSTEQLGLLLKLEGTVPIELNSDLVVRPELLKQECSRAVRECEKAISAGRTAVLYTKRKLLAPENMTEEEKLALSTRIADAVTDCVASISKRPAFVIAKGGITSSEVGRVALDIKKAVVMGQAAPGVPVWKPTKSSRYVGAPYIIFPGNVGESETLSDIVKKLQNALK